MKLCRVMWILAVLCAAGVPMLSQAQNNTCEGTEEPDVYLGGIIGTQRYGTVGNITGYSLGTESCNRGTCWAEWISSCSGGNVCRHPVIAQHLYRLKDGRFEQIGQSWVKHSFATLDNPLCSGDCISADGQHLGVNCSDPYWAGLNGDQTRLGPKSEINAETGEHFHPYMAQGNTGNAIYKRLQVHNDDLNPALNSGALYFAEGQYVTLDDTQAGNNGNNSSYRRATISTGGTGVYNLNLVGSDDFNDTEHYTPALFAWAANQSGVNVKSIEQKFVGGSAATNLGGGMYHYEYAIQNVTSDRAIGSFTVPIPKNAVITNVGFHDVDYHSGEPYDGTDWIVEINNNANPPTIVWRTAQTYAQDPNANALRWGTTYNFRFDMNKAPVAAQITLGYFKPGAESDPKWISHGPNRCGDTLCDVFETQTSCPADCAFQGTAGRVEGGLSVDYNELTGEVMLDWDLSCIGGDSDYEIYEGQIGDFTSHLSRMCSTGGSPNATLIPGFDAAYYLVVPSNGSREGSYGLDSDGAERPQGVSACFSQAIEECP